jgi:hypothetical protein
MGCTSSAERQVRTQTRQQDMMGNMMANMVNMQQAQLAKQQQMVRDDPECKQLFDQQALIQQKILTAMQAGDGAGISQGQLEMGQLQKNPKWMKMMMPDMQEMTQVTRNGVTQMGSGGNTRVTTHKFTSNNSTNAAPMAAAFPVHSATTDPSSMFSYMSSGGGFGDGGNFGGGTTNYGGGTTDYGGGTTDYGGGTTDYGGGTTDFGSSY